MNLTIVYDNEIYEKDMGLKSDWGFSCLIETKKDTILFDTGANGEILLNNMKLLGINPEDIDKIVISHEHWDHKGGLKALINYNNIELYRLRNKIPDKEFDPSFISTPQKIADKIFTTGRLEGTTGEQSLILEGKNGRCVLVGCSHPGVKNILNAAMRKGSISGLIGGFHSFNDFLILEDLDFVCPCHCTQHKRRIEELYPTKYVKCGVGRRIEI